MSIVKVITIAGKVSEYDVKYTKAYVAKIISKQSDLYQELNPSDVPYNAVKEIYVDGVLEAELIGSNLLYVQKRPKPKQEDPHKLDNQDLEGTGYRWITANQTEEFDEDHAMDMVMNNMLEDFTDEEIEEMMKLEEDIDSQSVSSSVPYWVTDTTFGNLEINYSTKNI